MTATGEIDPTPSAVDTAGPTAPPAVPATARSPLATAGAAYLGAVLSLALIAVGGVGIRDGVRAAGWITGSSWTGAAAERVDGLRFAGWMSFAGVAAVIVGVVIVVVAIKPRRKTSLEVSGRSSIVIARSDLARAAATAARDVPGVVDARATASRRKLNMNVKTTAGKGDHAAVKTAVSNAVGNALDMLAATPKIVVRTRTVGGSE